MPRPSVFVEMALNGSPFTGTPVWTDVSSLCKQISIRRGRRSEFEQADAGTVEVTLDNADGRFTPGRASSPAPFQGNIVPQRGLRVRARHDFSEYALGLGAIERWPVPYTRTGYSDVTVQAVDAFSFLSRPIRRAYQALVLSDKPVHYWPLNDDSFPDDAGVEQRVNSENIVEGATEPASVVTAKSPVTSTYLFGQPILVPDLLGTGIKFTSAAEASGKRGGKALQLGYREGSTWRGGRITEAMLAAGVTIEMVCYIDPATPPGSLLFGQVQPSANSGYNGVLVYYGTAGGDRGLRVVYAGQDLATGTLDRSTADYAGGYLHLWVQITGATSRIYVGSSVGLGVFGPFNVWSHTGGTLNYTATNPALKDDQVVAAAVPGAIVNGYPIDHLASVEVTHVAVYDRELTLDEMQDRLDLVGSSLTDSDTARGRIGDVLDMAGWPAGDRDIPVRATDTELSSGPDWEQNTSALTLLQDAAKASLGVLFVAGNGKVTYRSRQELVNRFGTALSPSAGTEIEGDGWQVASELDDIVNVVRLSDSGGNEIERVDAASRDQYGRRVYADTIDTRDLAGTAEWLLHLRSQPQVRMPTVTVNPTVNENLWPIVLGLEIGDRLSIQELPSTAPSATYEAVVEEIHHDITPGDPVVWRTTVGLSPAERLTMAVFDHATFGVFDSPQTVFGF